MRSASRAVPARSEDRLEARIHLIRGVRVMLDSDLAALYGVPTKRLNQAVRRNRKRFPSDFMFQLTSAELANLRSQIVTSSLGHGGRRFRPLAFTEQGVAMLSSVLNSERAIAVNVLIMRAFVRLRAALGESAELRRQIQELERRIGEHADILGEVLRAIEALATPPRTYAIGFRTHEKKEAATRSRRS